MAEALKDQFDLSVAYRLGEALRDVYPAFQLEDFVTDVSVSYASLELMERAWRMADTLKHYLPSAYPEAIRLIIASLDAACVEPKEWGMTGFLYLPYVFFVAKYGLDDFDVSMQAQYELTQRFTAEFSIRPYLERYPERSLEYLKQWVNDPSVHVRRLVSEGTRPRLPWASRLRVFEANVQPIIQLLDQLKDDSELYVRRSVANHWNDLSKDMPDVVLAHMRQWQHNASPARKWLVRHALRSLVKQGNQEALAIMGFNDVAAIELHHISYSPKQPYLGDSIRIAFDVLNTDSTAQALCVDLRIHFIKANGASSPKIFKLKEFFLEAGVCTRLEKKVSLAELTTRKHYRGMHRVEVLINGQTFDIGAFELLA